VFEIRVQERRGIIDFHPHLGYQYTKEEVEVEEMVMIV